MKSLLTYLDYSVILLSLANSWVYMLRLFNDVPWALCSRPGYWLQGLWFLLLPQICIQYCFRNWLQFQL